MKLNNRGIAPAIIILLIAIIAGLVAGGGAWYYQKIQDEKLKKDQNAALAKEKEEKDKKEKEVPSDFTKITLNETDIFYPTSWGDPKKEISKEDFSMQNEPFPTFAGEMGIFGEYKETLKVMNAGSYGKYDQSKENLDLLKDIYNKKKIDSSKLMAAGNEGYLPIINAQVTAYNPTYVQNNDASWRGFWYLANVGQAYTAEISFVAVMYNKEKDRVVTIHAKVESDKSYQLENKIQKSENPEIVNVEVINYMKTAYEKDTEVKKIVDEKMLKVCNFVK